MIGRCFVSQITYRPRVPIHHCNVGDWRSFLFVRDGKLRSVRGPARRSFGNIVGLRQIVRFASSAGNREQIIGFRSCVVRLIKDPFSVRRPESATLAVVRLAELNGPAARGTHLPEIEASGKIRCKHNLLAVWRPSAASGCPRVKKIINGHRACAAQFGRRDIPGLGNLAVVGRCGCQGHNHRRANQ